MANSAYRWMLPVLILVGCARAYPDEPGAVARHIAFSQASTEPVVQVTWSDMRTLRKWSRSFFSDSRVEVSDIGPDGKPIAPPLPWTVGKEVLDSMLAIAVEGRLVESNQEELLASIRRTGRYVPYSEDSIVLTVALRFSIPEEAPNGARDLLQVYRIQDPLGMRERCPDVPELAALAKLFELTQAIAPR